MKAFAVTSTMRIKALPDLPTIAEAGVPGYGGTPWFSVVAPAGTPRPIIDKLNAATNAALAAPDVISVLRAQGQDPLGGSPEDFARYIESEIKKGKVLAEAAGLKKD